MQTIYEPKGRAREYCELALNLYRGCSHGCTYCYAPKCLHISPEVFHEEPEPRMAVMAHLEKAAVQFKGREVFLCFSTDPYQPLDDEYQLTRQAIKVLHAAGVKVRILTKGGFRSERDFDLLAARPDLSSYGATLTFINSLDSAEWEPGAAPPLARMEAIAHAYALGIPTWLSMEPVIRPLETLHLIEAMAPYVDMYKVGKLNYHPLAKEIDWAKFARDAVDLLTSLGKQFYIKEDLAKYLTEAHF